MLRGQHQKLDISFLEPEMEDTEKSDFLDSVMGGI